LQRHWPVIRQDDVGTSMSAVACRLFLKSAVPMNHWQHMHAYFEVYGLKVCVVSYTRDEKNEGGAFA